MSKELRVPDYIEHILEAIEKISSYLGDTDEAAFAKSSLLQDATIRNLEIIGEASRNIARADADFARKNPAIPLARAIGMRNSLTHGYFEVKLDVVWRTVTQDLPALRSAITQWRASTGGENV